ncbi:DUF2849 domain-containing protein [Paenalcaligenes sp. Me131]|uniref:DUF2849 domain-containing protein n=1 Tax=Paenalcaligenes sp. Me131 TaxID=3392636 RepID=UPI003D29C49F
MSDYHLISANRLHDGAVVWLDSRYQWVEALEHAHAFDEEALVAAQQAAQEGVTNNEIVDPVPQEAERTPKGIVPVTFREQLRARGPSVRADLGKQAGAEQDQYSNSLAPAAGEFAPHAGIYQYDDSERTFLKERAQAFSQQVQRRLSGELTEEQFKVYRLMNGLYLQLHGYMLRVAIPYGTLSAVQLSQLAYVARRFDKGYGHFTTRQNLQYNWPKLSDAAEILSVLADADLHCIQTSGNCIRNVTTDEFAGAAADERVDPRVYAEIMRQWSTEHPEFTYLPRKFKIAITGSADDRAAIRFHDIGIIADKNEAGEIAFHIYAGGGLGRTPVVGTLVREWLPERDLLRYIEAILRVYNALGRRDNIYKARIKILVRELKPETFIQMIDTEFAALLADRPALDSTIVEAVQARFVAPALEQNLAPHSASFTVARAQNPAFAHWVDHNSHPHKQSGYLSVVISLKPNGGIPGDASAEQMELVASLAERYSLNEVRVTHRQNLVLPHVKQDDVYAVWQALCDAGLATSNIGLVSDSIACPGMDYCSLATARSVPVAQRIALRFSEEKQREVGPLSINVSGCINACAHHHVAHIGILGLDKGGQESYQITLGGRSDQDAALGKILGPSVSYDEVPEVIEALVDIYLKERQGSERFIDTYNRVGITVFKEALTHAV